MYKRKLHCDFTAARIHIISQSFSVLISAAKGGKMSVNEKFIIIRNTKSIRFICIVNVGSARSTCSKTRAILSKLSGLVTQKNFKKQLRASYTLTETKSRWKICVIRWLSLLSTVKVQWSIFGVHYLWLH